MKQHQLLALFQEHLQSVNAPKVNGDEPVATIYASKDVKVDSKKNRIRLPILGWVDTDDITDNISFDWVATFPEGNEWSMTLGNGNPFECDDLPQKNGVVCAVPFGFSI